MDQINNLPFIDDAKIVIDEDIEANYSKLLLLGWFQEFKQRKPDEKIVLLLFSTPKYTYQNYFDQLDLKNIEIKDYYTIDIKENQNNISDKLDDILVDNSNKSIIVIDCISSLSLAVGIQKASRFIEKLKRKVNRLICINQSDFGTYNIPNIKTLGNYYLKLESTLKNSYNNSMNYLVNCTLQKPNGSVTKQTEFIMQNLETFCIKSCKKEVKEKKCTNNVEPATQSMQATFRLDINNREMEQKKNVDLPYITTSRIIYNPDDVDDIDEEDPDDDLCI